MIIIKNLRREKPQNPWDARVDRANKILGNQFYMVNESQRDTVCDKYAEWFEDASKNNSMVITELNRMMGIYKEYGKLNLFCWCTPKRCHAETIQAYLTKQTLKQKRLF